ncbi:DUF551 domain-containing protein [Klebsiella pneumoniae]|nr:DUF551 domain-containing protein [Klebsiella pneumoniae]CAA1284166.1 Protein of uncharacterised function (DUF551) [Klebsiella pneumoniae]VUH70708.1 Eaa1 [Klebsiella pneumoniae]
MTSKFSIDNRELLQIISSGEAVVGIDFGNLIVRELAAFRLAAMDSEPVAVIDLANLDYLRSGADADVWPPEREEMRDVFLYLHAQPTPVVPDEKDKTVDADDHPLLWSFNEGWNACRAAMLAAAPHDTPALNSLQSVDSVAGKWIPVSEQMPEDRTQVILWDAEIGEVTSGHYSHKTQTFYHCGDAIENEITHWMPPPCAPQEVKGE